MKIKSESEKYNREVIVVLGVGRSGTSLVMQALEALDVGLSENMIPPNASNPKGFHEDADIVEIHKELLKELGASPITPLKDDWLNSRQAKVALEKLKELVEYQLEKNNGRWAFKDPRTATFLPLWNKLFNQLKVIPRYILAVREPSTVIQSFKDQYNDKQSFSELVYLLRTLDALYHTVCDCHFVLYENWFKVPNDTLSSLSKFIYGNECRVNKSISPLVIEKLNKASKKVTSQTVDAVANPLTIDLYSSIKESVDRENKNHLMEKVKRLKAMLELFSPWHELIERNKDVITELSAKNKKLKGVWEENSDLKKEYKIKGIILEKYKIAFYEASCGFESIDRMNQL